MRKKFSGQVNGCNTHESKLHHYFQFFNFDFFYYYIRQKKLNKILKNLNKYKNYHITLVILKFTCVLY